MGKMEGKVRTEARQDYAEEDHRSPSDERSREEEVVSTHEGALGREERVESISVFLILRKTREWRHKWPTCSARAFVRRASTHVDAFGSNRQSLDPVTETARFPLRIIDALCAGRPGSSSFPYQHNGHAYA